MCRKFLSSQGTLPPFLCHLFFSLPEIVEDLGAENMRTNIQINYPKQRCNCLDQLMRDVYIVHGDLYSLFTYNKGKFQNAARIVLKAI